MSPRRSLAAIWAGPAAECPHRTKFPPASFISRSVDSCSQSGRAAPSPGHSSVGFWPHPRSLSARPLSANPVAVSQRGTRMPSGTSVASTRTPSTKSAHVTRYRCGESGSQNRGLMTTPDTAADALARAAICTVCSAVSTRAPSASYTSALTTTRAADARPFSIGTSTWTVAASPRTPVAYTYGPAVCRKL